MKYSALLLLSVLLVACNQPDSAKKADEAVTDTSGKGEINIGGKKSLPEQPLTQDSARSVVNDRLLLQASAEILGAIKGKDFAKLSSFFHPTLGVRFSAYAYIDTIHDQTISRQELISLSQNQKIINWGVYDGKEEPIKLNINKYFSRFVYDKDYLNAEIKSINKFNGGGNSLNNLKEVYPQYDFVEFYFSGFEPKYEGMDWKLLRLVFKTESKHGWLIAIIHDEWTI